MFGFLLDLFKPQTPRAPAITSEASMAMECHDFYPFLTRFANNPRFGLPDDFTASIVEALPDIPESASRRWKVEGSFDGQAMQLEVEIITDDPEAPDLNFFSSAAVIEEIDRELSEFADAKEI
ncbi:MAG: hypothetical protein AAF686_06930 [Pseudomonadota bacterium]